MRDGVILPPVEGAVGRERLRFAPTTPPPVQRPEVLDRQAIQNMTAASASALDLDLDWSQVKPLHATGATNTGAIEQPRRRLSALVQSVLGVAR